MCIPCVMCGACIGEYRGDPMDEGKCPECGEGIDPESICCPHCYTLIPRASKTSSSIPSSSLRILENAE